ncbi:hypothetical protein PG989_010429 [Apiospora arundinis]|uniref:Rhodopsin domain-containing protein n=1 Tax=Apiospora arundinis TaxID=335852 RepID=A0ABR2JDV7_9PEZI
MSSYPLTFYNFVTFNVIYATASIYIVLNVVVISLRLFSSWKRHGRLAVGDWCGLTATLFTLALAIIMLIGARPHSIGRHDQDIRDGAEEVLISMVDYKLHFAYNIIFTLAVGFIRLTLLLLFLKLFLHHPLYRTIQVMIALVVIWVACYLVMAFSCGKAPDASGVSPYDVTARLCPGFKLGPAAQQKIGFSVALTDCIIDVVMFLLPLYPVLKMNMRGRNKIWVSVVFLLGIFSITASIIKLAIFTIINAPLGTSPHDFRGSSKMTSATVRTHESAPVGVDDVNGVSGTIAWWTMTECSFGNITCNLPIISGYIFQRFFSARVKSISSQIVTIGRKSFRLNNKGQSPPGQQTLDETVSHLTRTVGTEDGPISPSTVEHIELSPLEIPTRPV